MKVVFHEDFCQVYTGDPAAAAGRMEAVVETIDPHVEFVSATPAVRRLSEMEGAVLPYSRADTTTKCSGKMCWP